MSSMDNSCNQKAQGPDPTVLDSTVPLAETAPYVATGPGTTLTPSSRVFAAWDRPESSVPDSADSDRGTYETLVPDLGLCSK